MKRYAAILMLVLVGCNNAPTPASYDYVPTLSAAIGIAEASKEQTPNITPAPAPAPGGVCTNCNGTGKLPGDGTIKPDCPVCGGDGKLDQSAASTPQSEPAAAVGNSDSSMPPAPTPLWLDSIDKAKAESKATGKPILVHFMFEGCAPCHKMDLEVFAKQSVVDVLDKFVLLRVDTLEMWGEVSACDAWEKAVGEPLDECPREILLDADGNVIGEPKFVDPPRDADGYVSYLNRLSHPKKGT